MKKSLSIFVSLFAVIGVISTATLLASPAFGKTQEKEDEAKPGKSQAMVAPSASISPVKAMQIASAKTGGKSKIAMFEFEDGHWIYGVVVAKNHKLMEVEIDANTGKIGDTEAIDPAGEAKEMQAELTKMANS